MSTSSTSAVANAKLSAVTEGTFVQDQALDLDRDRAERFHMQADVMSG